MLGSARKNDLAQMGQWSPSLSLFALITHFLQTDLEQHSRMYGFLSSYRQWSQSSSRGIFAVLDTERSTSPAYSARSSLKFAMVATCFCAPSSAFGWPASRAGSSALRRSFSP